MESALRTTVLSGAILTGLALGAVVAALLLTPVNVIPYPYPTEGSDEERKKSVMMYVLP
jgi:hypothetical protein